MAWIDKFKKKPLLTNDEVLERLAASEAQADQLLPMTIAGTSQYEMVVHYKQMVEEIRKLVILYFDKGEPIPARLNAFIKDMKLGSEPPPL